MGACKNNLQLTDFGKHDMQHAGTRSSALSQFHGIQWDALELLHEHRRIATGPALMVNCVRSEGVHFRRGLPCGSQPVVIWESL